MIEMATSLPPHTERRLGKKPKREDPRTLKLVKYMPATLPATPDIDDWSTKMTDIGPVLNNEIGDCAIAAPVHGVQAWSSLTETQIIITDPQALQAYKDVSGYNGTPDTDVGCNMLDVLKYWKKPPGIGDKQIEAYAELDRLNWDHIDFTIHGFGGFYGGLALPKSCQNQVSWAVSPGGTDGDPGKGSWGGHAIWILGRDRIRRMLKFVSWGLLMEMSYEFWEEYGDEAYACLSSSDWAEDQLTPSDFDLTTLRSDIVTVAA